MKFSITDKISETVSLIRNKKMYFIGRNKCMIKKIECWPVFKQDPQAVDFGTLNTSWSAGLRDLESLFQGTITRTSPYTSEKTRATPFLGDQIVFT